MNGPDLSHLLDGDGSDRPSPDVLAGIVLRHRRQRIKRARTAATLGIVLALAGVGVGIGLSRQGSTVTASPPLTPGVGKVGSGATSTTGLLPAAPGSAPAGLGWVGVSALSSSELAPTAFGLANRLNPAGNLQASGAYSAVSPGLGALCSIFSCPPGEPGDSVLGSVLIRHLFTRTSDGVTIRAFTALWSEAPLELVPVSPGSPSSGAPVGSGTTGVSGGSLPSSTTAVSPSAPATVTSGTQAKSPGSTPVPPALPSSCALTRALVVEVSDAGAVGVITVPLGPSVARPIDVLSDQVLGVAERSPMAVVVTHTTGGTKTVRVEFAGGGRDEMTVVDGWAVLVHRLALGKSTAPSGRGTPTTLGQATVYALSSTGKVLEQAVAPGSGALAMAVEACVASGGNVHKIGASGSGSGSTGASGSGSSGSSGTSGSSLGPSGFAASTGPAGSFSVTPPAKPNGG